MQPAEHGAGRSGVCAVLDDGSVHCWANPGSQQSGYAGMSLTARPRLIEFCGDD